MHRTHKILAGLATAALLLPAAAAAQTAPALDTQVKSLMEQIQALQMQLKTLLASSSPMMKKETREDGMHMNRGQMGKAACIYLKRNLRVGAEGDDVKKLQEMLAQDSESGFKGKATGFFGPMTAQAMAKFQMRAGIASSTDGTVGPATRGFFERACGKGMGERMKDRMEDGMGTSTSGMGHGMRGDDNMGIPGMPGVMGPVLSGTITVSSSSSITVQGKEGKTRVVNVSSSTAIQVPGSTPNTWVAGSSADLTVGKMVRVEGQPQSDGSLTAAIIRVGTTQ